MTPTELIQAAKQDGLTFTVKAPEGLKVLGKPDVLQRWLPVLRPQKPAILGVLLHDERQSIMRRMVEWNERAALMTNVHTTPDQAELLAWHDLNLDEAFFGLRRVN